jgi:hypothetical protein
MIQNLIENLKSRRPIFHSEDDLKFELAMEIKKLYPNADVRLEKPFEIKMDEETKRIYYDIYFKIGDTEYVIELKYKTTKIDKKDSKEVNGEEYYLKHHGADDLTRYAIRKDIYRVEQFVKQAQNRKGYVVFITNDRTYFKDISGKINLNKNLSLHDDFEILKEIVCWNRTYEQENNPKHFTKSKENSYKLNLDNRYNVKWENYSTVQNSDFRYILFTVK